jgi:hypothetical protein
MVTKTILVDGRPVTLSKVKSIEDVGPKHVYDLEVAEDHNYFAGGINVHNCGYHEMLDDVQSRTGEECYRLKDTFVQYRHRRLLVYPAGPDKRVLRGRTRFLAGIDELGWFQHGAEAAKNIKMNAAEVYIALERSLLTVRAKAKSVIRGGFYNVPFGYFINISSPSSVRDKIMELVRKAQGSKVILGLNYPTWKMNPHVPRSALAEEFRKDPETAMRDYGAQPPLTNSPFISSGDKLELCWAKKPQALKLRYHVVRSSDRKTSELYATADEIRQPNKDGAVSFKLSSPCTVKS